MTPPADVVVFAALMVALIVAGVLGIAVDRRCGDRPLARQWIGIGITVCFTLASMACGALLVSAT